MQQTTVGVTESHACGQYVKPGTPSVAGQAG
jgi:hypothetical protein